MSETFSFDVLNPQQMCHKAAAVMESKAKTPHSRAFGLAVMAGVFIGLGFIYCGIANVSGAGKIVGGFVFSLGLTLCVVVGGDLFTSTTMTIIPRCGGQITWGRMFANWGVVYTGNFLGSILLVAIILLSGHPWDYEGGIGIWYLTVTAHKLSYTFVNALFLGVMCNLMVCLGVWMSFSGRSFTDKMLACLFPVGLFIACGFEHSIANMYMIPMGILCSQTIPADIAAKVPNLQEMREVMTWSNFVLKNLLPVTLGNIIGGGIMVGWFHWFMYLRKGSNS